MALPVPIGIRATFGGTSETPTAPWNESTISFRPPSPERRIIVWVKPSFARPISLD
jgi:hypothetical protein